MPDDSKEIVLDPDRRAETPGVEEYCQKCECPVVAHKIKAPLGAVEQRERGKAEGEKREAAKASRPKVGGIL